MVTWIVSIVQGVLSGLAVISMFKLLMIVFNVFPDIDVTFLNSIVGAYAQIIYSE